MDSRREAMLAAQGHIGGADVSRSHNMARRREVILAGASALAMPAWAQPKPVRFIVPYPPGGPLDIVARALADAVKDSLGTVVVDNRPGAGGNLGADLAAKSAPDGHTIVMGAVATHALWYPPTNRKTTPPAPSLFLYHSAYGTH